MFTHLALGHLWVSDSQRSVYQAEKLFAGLGCGVMLFALFKVLLQQREQRAGSVFAVIFSTVMTVSAADAHAMLGGNLLCSMTV